MKTPIEIIRTQYEPIKYRTRNSKEDTYVRKLTWIFAEIQAIQPEEVPMAWCANYGTLQGLAGIVDNIKENPYLIARNTVPMRSHGRNLTAPVMLWQALNRYRQFIRPNNRLKVIQRLKHTKASVPYTTIKRIKTRISFPTKQCVRESSSSDMRFSPNFVLTPSEGMQYSSTLLCQSTKPAIAVR